MPHLSSGAKNSKGLGDVAERRPEGMWTHIFGVSHLVFVNDLTHGSVSASVPFLSETSELNKK